MDKSLIAGALCSAFFSSIAFASPVNLPTGIKGQDGAGLISNLPVDVSAGFLNDYVGKRELGKDSGNVNFDMTGGKIILSVFRSLDIYTMLGDIHNAELKANIDGDDVRFNFSDKFMWGIGASAVLYDWKDTGVQIFSDGNYREARGIGLDSVTVDGTKHTSGILNHDCPVIS